MRPHQLPAAATRSRQRGAQGGRWSAPCLREACRRVSPFALTAQRDGSFGPQWDAGEAFHAALGVDVPFGGDLLTLSCLERLGWRYEPELEDLYEVGVRERGSCEDHVAGVGCPVASAASPRRRVSRSLLSPLRCSLRRKKTSLAAQTTQTL